MNSIKSIIALLIIASDDSISLSLRPPCQDDENYTFGDFSYNGKMVKRTCSWLSENSVLMRKRTERWCNRRWIGTFIRDKCQNTCNSCDMTELIFCEDKKGENGDVWYDKWGSGCDFYKDTSNCDKFGYSNRAFGNMGMTAKTACCVCGGGDLILG